MEAWLQIYEEKSFCMFSGKLWVFVGALFFLYYKDNAALIKK